MSKQQPAAPQEEPEPALRIEISRYKSIVEALSDPKKTRRIVGSILMLGVLLFVGITVITITVKRMYPYSDIRTNALGATTIRDESTEIAYWLFSTSELWANSGIKVESGDVLTIRSSGRTYTAIHHLYDHAVNNSRLSHEWLDSDGNMHGTGRELSESDRLRAKYRLFPNKPQNALIMQVVDDDRCDTVCNPLNSDRFYYIGTERSEVRINNSGTLYFAVNDIVLTRGNIFRMSLENANRIADLMGGDIGKSFEREVVDAAGRDSALGYKERIDRLLHHTAAWYEKNAAARSSYDSCSHSSRSFRFGANCECASRPDSLKSFEERLKTEMNYYADENYFDAWFDDNIGSLLIVVERKN